MSLAMLAGAQMGVMAQDQVVQMDNATGTTYYATLGDAVKAAERSNSLPTLTLLMSVDMEFGSVTVTKPMVLNLNGKTILSSAETLLYVNGNEAALTITDSSKRQNGRIYQDVTTNATCISVSQGSLTLNAGKVSANTSAQNSSACAVRVASQGSLTMTSGTIEANAVSNASAVSISGNSSKMEISGGNVVANAEDTKAYGISVSAGSTLNVNGGTISAIAGFETGYGITTSGNVSITGGTVSADAHSFTASMYIGNSANVTIDGGNFSSASKVNVLVDLQTNAPAQNVKVNGGNFEHELGLVRYTTAGKYIVPIAEGTDKYEDGYRYTISDKPYTTAIALNIQKKKEYATLEAALSEAVYGDTISLQNDYRLTQDATVPNGVVLLIPFDMKNTCFTKYPNSSYLHIEEYIYRTLTLAENVTLNVQGEMSVCAEQTSTESSQWTGQGSVYGGHAFVSMEQGARINVDGGLYCWGYIAGKGSVSINSTATLYEAFQFMDWHGGNRSFEYVDYCYPYNQYYVHNIEVPVTFSYGARELLGTDMYFNDEMHRVDDMSYIAPESDGTGLFRMAPGSKIVKTYVGETDRQQYVISGDVALGTLVMDYGGMQLPSEEWVFPLTNNMDITLQSGKLSVPNDYSMLAGATLTIGKDATMVIEKDCRFYAYDKDDWGRFAVYYVFPLEYTIANGHKNQSIRWGGAGATSATAKAQIKNAVIDVKGTMQVDGDFMTSLHGASVICSEGSGQIVLNNADILAVDTLYTPLENGFDVKAVAATPAQLTNADGGRTSVSVNATGDANGDGSVNVFDMVAIADNILNASTVDRYGADVNEDGQINVFDLTGVSSIILNNGENQSETPELPLRYQYTNGKWIRK